MALLRLLVGCHIIGDFIFQSDKLCEKKKEGNKFLLCHSFLYTLPFLLLFFLVGTTWYYILCSLSFVFATHYAIDYWKIYEEKKQRDKLREEPKKDKQNPKQKDKQSDFWFFNIDQISHLVVLVIIWIIFRNCTINVYAINQFLKEAEIDISIEKIFNVLMVFLIILKPTSIFIDEFIKYLNISCDNDENDYFEKRTEANKESFKTDKKPGAYIGYLERILVVILSLMNVWSSIGFVLTAKSIARYKQLSDKNFAKKYLIGTLLSLSISLLTFAFYLL